MRVVFVASEGVPFSKTGGLADVIGALPQALAALGVEVVVLLPRYRITTPGPMVPVGAGITIPLSAGFRFASAQDGGVIKNVQIYLIDCPEFFDRDGLYQIPGTSADHRDNHLRFAGFCLAALEFIKRLGPPPDIIHCHDWQTALIPLYLRLNYAPDLYFADTRVAFTVHNLAFHGEFPHHALADISLDDSVYHYDALEYYGRINLLKGGLIFAHALTTVSPKYAEEIQTAEYGTGLEGVLKRQSGILRGILNGADYDAWNPAIDRFIPANYSADDLEGKAECKRELLRTMGVEWPEMHRPVLGIVSRFDRQKGFDLLAEIAEGLAARDLYLVTLGTGAREYEEFFERLARRHSGRFLTKVAYDNKLAHLIEAGADMFLMPSRYEPCGLNQMYSMKYGTVPVVRGTGGLENSVEQFDGTTGTGFKFYDYTGAALLHEIDEARNVYYQPDVWKRIMVNGMLKDFSWESSARQYLSVYNSLAPAKAIAV